MSAADCPDCKECFEETNRLHADVEWLTKSVNEAWDFHEIAERERDGALAQVAVYIKMVDECLYTYEDAYALLKRLGRLDIPDQARDLLDRLQVAEGVALFCDKARVQGLELQLQRAEAVVRAFKPLYDGAKCRHCNGKILEHETWCIVRLKAEWEEERA